MKEVPIVEVTGEKRIKNRILAAEGEEGHGSRSSREGIYLSRLVVKAGEKEIEKVRVAGKRKSQDDENVIK